MFRCRQMIFLLAFIMLLCSGCVSSDSPLEIPFSDADWTNTAEDIQKLNGDPQSTYASVYGGDCYTYEQEYLERSGTIKYMFDENETLMCVAWAYTAVDSSDLDEVYNQIQEFANESYGESEDSPVGVNNTGAIWRLDSGTIIITAMSTAEVHALQFAYINPDANTNENVYTSE